MIGGHNGAGKPGTGARRPWRARAFAAARARSCALLLGLFDTNGLPTAEALGAWQAARRDADQLWTELTAK